MSEPFGGPTLVFSRVRAFEVEDFDDIEPRSISYLIKGILPERGVAFVVGASKGGKTFISLDWALKLASGATVMGRKAQHVGVVYVGAEDPDGCRARIKAWKRKNPRQSYTPFKFIGRPINLLDDDEVAQLIAELLDIAAIYDGNDHRLGLVVLDTFAKCMPGGDENGSVDGGRALAALQKIEREIGCLVMAVAHHGKTGASNGIRGWSGYDAGSDATITVERDDLIPDQRKLTLSKVKNGPDGAEVGFRLERQDLGMVDSDGEPMWSCVVAYDSLAPEKITKAARRKAMSTNAALVHASVGQLIDGRHCQPVPTHFEGVRMGTQAVRRGDLSLQAATHGLKFDGDTDPAYRQRFGRAIAELASQRRVRVEGDLIWLI
jgi:hypothetical protein